MFESVVKYFTQFTLICRDG